MIKGSTGKMLLHEFSLARTSVCLPLATISQNVSSPGFRRILDLINNYLMFIQSMYFASYKPLPGLPSKFGGNNSTPQRTMKVCTTMRKCSC